MYTFDQFCNIVLINVAINSYDRPPKNLGHMPPVVSLIELFRHFSSIAQAKGENALIWEAPDMFDHPNAKERDAVIKLNRKLRDNPDTNIPSQFEQYEDIDFAVN